MRLWGAVIFHGAFFDFALLRGFLFLPARYIYNIIETDIGEIRRPFKASLRRICGRRGGGETVEVKPWLRVRKDTNISGKVFTP